MLCTAESRQSQTKTRTTRRERDKRGTSCTSERKSHNGVATCSARRRHDKRAKRNLRVRVQLEANTSSAERVTRADEVTRKRGYVLCTAETRQARQAKPKSTRAYVLCTAETRQACQAKPKSTCITRSKHGHRKCDIVVVFDASERSGTPKVRYCRRV